MSAVVVESDVRPWQPHSVPKEHGGPAMCYPGDELYPADLPGFYAVSAGSRHRFYMKTLPKREGGSGGRGIVGGQPLSLELERTVSVPFGGEAWASTRRL